MQDELGGKIMKKFVGLRAKSYSYLIEDGSKDKKAIGTKKCAINKKFKFEDNKNCLEATQPENEINCLRKIDVDSLEESHKEFRNNNKLILKTQQRFKSVTYAYVTSKDLVSKKEELKLNNIIEK